MKAKNIKNLNNALTVEEALARKDRRCWQEAMKSEHNLLLCNETCELVDLSKGRKTIGCRKRPLQKEKIQRLVDTFCTDFESDVEPYEDSGSEYLASEHSSSEFDLEFPKDYEFLERKTDNFLLVRSESSHQSIDESMAKFKGRSSLKQYLLLQPTKRGIKICGRCDSRTGYVYDFDRYSGKDSEANKGTLGERVVKNIHNNNGTIGYLWMDTKEVMVLSNCHGNESVEISRTGKDETKIKLSCPEAIQFYNSHMGGVDLSDQLTGLYEVDRKSMKWWKKVFYKLLFTTAVTAWIVCKELNK
ncbi:hypothetical protein ILUMI_08971 [Ignelater luminosus]|uniref:PiggyBac transposable element-derived protein domain-containing protein n=1 Tax=Ignelater luminosus TaxID=2038154 RepID=A0A8K0D0X1_IGNLU|nr:hypothetical protein ILUMI_08971 [Ignelater luminosus]